MSATAAKLQRKTQKPRRSADQRRRKEIGFTVPKWGNPGVAENQDIQVQTKKKV